MNEKKSKYTPKKAASNKKYDAAHTKNYSFKVIDNTEGDIIAWLDGIENKSRYIKSLIRADMEKHKGDSE